MTPRQTLLACLLGLVTGGGAAVVQDGFFAPSTAVVADASSARALGEQRLSQAALPQDVVVSIYPPRPRAPGLGGLLDVIDRDHKGYVTIDDIKAYYEATRRTRHAAAEEPLAPR